MYGKNGQESWQSFQSSIFELIGGRYNSRHHMVHDLEELLGLQRVAIYDRISLKRMLTLSECFILLRHYQLTTKVISQLWSSKVLVNFSAMEHAPATLEQYLKPLYASMAIMASTPGVHLYYAANELPFYHYYRRPGIALFKYYVWDMLTWKDKENPGVTFDRAYIRRLQDDLQPMFDEMVMHYARFATTEVWHTNLLHNTLHQIIYIHQLDLLPDKTLIADLCDDLISILEDIKNMATNGHKEGHPEYPYLLYHNELAHTNNMALVQAAEMSQVFFAYDNPNVMYARDPRLSAYTKAYFERLIAHAESLSSASRKIRAQFFHNLMHQVHAFRATIVE